MQKAKNKYAAWAIICILFAAFIFLFSYLYPYGEDEYLYTYKSVGEVLYQYFLSWLLWNPRIGLLAVSFILYLGKWSFLLLNPFMQLALVFAEFYFIFLRLPDFKTFKDIIPLSLLMLFACFAVSVPDNTLFWIGGAGNYSWALLPFMITLALLRAEAEGKSIIKDGLSSKIIMLFAGFVTGMSNENNSPMFLMCIGGFWLYAKYKKMQIKEWIYWAAAGGLCGAALLFGAPGSYSRMGGWEFAGYAALPVTQKLFMFINHLQDLISATLYAPVILALGLPVALLNKDVKVRAFRSKDIILSILCFSAACVLAFVLFMAPRPPERAFYSSSVFFIISFVFFIKYITETFKINVYKTVFLPLFCVTVAILPLFTIPYIDLYMQDARIRQAAQEARLSGKEYISVQRIKTINGPTKNLSVLFLDYTRFKPEIIKKHFGVYLK